MMNTIGLPQIKPEGMTLSPDYPEVKAWSGLSKEFEEYFNNRYSSKWYKPLKQIFYKIAKESWDKALMEAAVKGIF